VAINVRDEIEFGHNNHFYEVHPDRVRSELGDRGYKRLDDLQHWLRYGQRNVTSENPYLPISYRIAPSVVVRGEAQLFGISSPRFAYRARFQDGSIVNARRLNTFAQNATEVYQLYSPSGRLSQNKAKREVILNKLLVQQGQSIADSIIRLPQRLADEGFHALECEIGYAYGEGTGEDSLSGTPFLQHTRIGGGLCAQATCFMASVLCHDRIKTIFAVPEITAITSGDPNRFELKGMEFNEIVDFFRDERVGLGSLPQCEDVSSPFMRRGIVTAFRSYLASGVPIVLSVNAEKMLEPGSIVDNNQVPINLKAAGTSWLDKYHCVALVGYSDEEDTFLMNDPATFPFLKASMDEIFNVRCLSEDSAATDPAVQYISDPAVQCISVVPKQVKMPLLRKRMPDNTYLMGLLEQAMALQMATPGRFVTICKTLANAGIKCDASDHYNLGTIRLVDFGKPDAELQQDLAWLPESYVEFLLKEVAEGTIRQTWHWIQLWQSSAPNSIPSLWVWDAEQKPSVHFADPEKYLIGVIAHLETKAHKDWSWDFYDPNIYPPEDTVPEEEPEEKPKKKPDEASIKPSLLSSYCAHGLSMPDSCEWIGPYNPANYPGSAENEDQISTVPAEVYLFMETEAKYWCDRFGIPDCKTAVDFLNMINDDQTKEITLQIIENLDKVQSKAVVIASFVPEIARSPDPTTGRCAGVNAVRRLIKFAEMFQEHGHSVHTLELVAGSRIQGIEAHLRSRRVSEITFFVDVLDDEITRPRLIENLVKSLKGLDDTQEIFLALELEPGHYSNLRNWSTAMMIGDSIQGNPHLQTRVGFNLDVGHWCVAGIERELLAHGRPLHPVRSRILHAHVSAIHPCAHFGDIPLSDVSDMEFRELCAWLRLLRQILANPGGLPGDPPFSGYASLELEAVLSEQLVEESYYLLNQWI
jgi:hypothetical protein